MQKIETIRLLKAERCSPDEIAIVVGMRADRVRHLIKRGCRWPRHRTDRERRELNLNRLAMRCGF